jgi:hypothetical protein
MKIKLSKLKPGLLLFNRQGTKFQLEDRIDVENGRAFCELRPPREPEEERASKTVETFLVNDKNLVELETYSTKKPLIIKEKTHIKTTFLHYDTTGALI